MVDLFIQIISFSVCHYDTSMETFCGVNAGTFGQSTNDRSNRQKHPECRFGYFFIFYYYDSVSEREREIYPQRMGFMHRILYDIRLFVVWMSNCAHSHRSTVTRLTNVFSSEKMRAPQAT